MRPIEIIDLNFQNEIETMSAILVRHAEGAVLVDCGPSSTLPALEVGLQRFGLDLGAITHILVTHIHLDHAGAAGTLAQHGSQVCVHPVGAPHLLDPARLLNSARRLYGEQMNSLWGDFLPVRPANLTEVQDGAGIVVGDLHFTALHTPGHAEHHVSYLLEDVLFSGDVGGIRMPALDYLRLPFVPPETHLEKWAASLERLRGTGARRIIPTHFGIYTDVEKHLTLGLRQLEQTGRWLEKVMPSGPDVPALEALYTERMHQAIAALDLDERQRSAYEGGAPASMAAAGLHRYWHKVRMPAEAM
ncbi:MAG: MBL fold metallo-hydrolase [Anaerolineales bacterium]|nr:MBL fold metallo-hydrolase [Anaerolineales bacterium]